MQSLRWTEEMEVVKEKEFKLLPEAIYTGRTIASHHVSKAGKESIKLQIEVQGHKANVFCYLTPAYMLLFKHFCEATDNMEAFAKKELTALHCHNKMVRMKIGIEEDDTYGSKNIVLDFLPNEAPKTTDEDIFNDDIPF